MIIKNLEPTPSSLPEYNRYARLEFDNKLKRPRASDLKGFISLAMTCSAARGICYNTYKPKVLRYRIEGKKSGSRNKTGGEGKADAELLFRKLSMSVYSEVFTLDISAASSSSFDQLSECLIQLPNLTALRYLGPQLSSDLFLWLPPTLKYLEIFIPSAYNSEAEFLQELTPKMIKIETLVLVDRSIGSFLGLIGSNGNKTMFGEDSWSSNESLAMKKVLRAVDGVKKLVLRVDPQFEKYAFEPIDSGSSLETLGEHAGKGGLRDLEEFILEVQVVEDYLMEGCQTNLFIDDIFDWLREDDRYKKMTKLRSIKLYIHVHGGEVPDDLPETIYGDTEEICMAARHGLGLDACASDIQDGFIPKLVELKNTLNAYANKRGSVTDFELQVRVAPTKGTPNAFFRNRPFVHLHAQFSAINSVRFIKAESNDGWQKSRAKMLNKVWKEFKDNIDPADFECLSDGYGSDGYREWMH